MEAAGSVKEGETESGASTAPLQNRDIIEKRCPPVAAVTLDELRSKLSRLQSARLVMPGAATAPPPGLVAQRSVLAQGPCMQSKEGSLRTRGSLAWSAGATACPTTRQCWRRHSRLQLAQQMEKDLSFRLTHIRQGP